MSDIQLDAAVTGGGLRSGTGDGDRPLRLICAMRGGPAESTVVRVDLGPSEWVLAIVPPGQTPEPGAAAIAGPFLPPSTPLFTLVRVPAAGYPGPGPAVLRYHQGRALTYCSEDQIAGPAAAALSALANQAFDDAGTGLVLTIIPVEASLLPGRLHPAAPIPLGPRGEGIAVCTDMITAELADALGAIWTAHAGNLLRPGKPRRAPARSA